ncbi:uncharacterized protein LOC119161287 [Rhipicephalus microplus]|nr:uncharacterized protein LOC119161287 [Rhipicephalus microplus]
MNGDHAGYVSLMTSMDVDHTGYVALTPPVMETGAKFASLEELSAALRLYEETHFTQFWRSSSRTIVGARKKGLKRPIKEELVYSEIIFSCANGGRKYTSKSTGARPNQRTFKIGCTARIKVVASADGNFLEVKLLDDVHNHPVSEACFRQLPKQRRLAADDLLETKKLQTFESDDEAIQKFLLRTGKVVLLRDLRNLGFTGSFHLKNQLGQGKDCQQQSDALDALVLEVQGAGGAFDVLATEENTLVGFFYQDRFMREAYQNYPEVVFVDVVYKTQGKGPLLILAVEDSNGETEVVGFALCVASDNITIRLVLERFVLHVGADAVDRTLTVMTDREMVERGLLRDMFPNATEVICLYQVLRAFRRQMTAEKMGISREEKARVLEILQCMCHAQDDNAYNELYQKLEHTCSATVLEHFSCHWHEIRSQWVQGLQEVPTLGNRTNKRLESVNQKVAHIVSKHELLDQLFHALKCFATCLRIERDQRAMQTILKIAAPPNMSEDEHKYMAFLTPYAFKRVSQQMQAARAMVEPDENYVSTCSSCNCWDATSYMLPCQHVFFERLRSGLPLYFEEGAAQRWTREYYKNACRLFTSEPKTTQQWSADGSGEEEPEDSPASKGSPFEKRKVAETGLLLQQLAACMVQLPAGPYERAVALVRDLKSAMEEGKEVCLVRIESNMEVQ